jgi:hypothetical protein
MLKPMLARLIALSVFATPVAAQVAPNPFAETKLDPKQLAAMIMNSQRTLKPASFVLGHKDEFALSPEQVKQIELLVRGEEDSVIVRQIRMNAAMSRQTEKRAESNVAPQNGWVGTINEKQLRDEACEASGIQVEFMVNLLRDRQAVGNILTARQIERIDEIEANEVLRAFKTKQP